MSDIAIEGILSMAVKDNAIYLECLVQDNNEDMLRKAFIKLSDGSVLSNDKIKIINIENQEKFNPIKTLEEWEAKIYKIDSYCV